MVKGSNKVKMRHHFFQLLPCNSLYGVFTPRTPDCSHTLWSSSVHKVSVLLFCRLLTSHKPKTNGPPARIVFRALGEIRCLHSGHMLLSLRDVPCEDSPFIRQCVLFHTVLLEFVPSTVQDLNKSQNACWRPELFLPSSYFHACLVVVLGEQTSVQTKLRNAVFTLQETQQPINKLCLRYIKGSA